LHGFSSPFNFIVIHSSLAGPMAVGKGYLSIQYASLPQTNSWCVLAGLMVQVKN